MQSGMKMDESLEAMLGEIDIGEAKLFYGAI